MYWKTLLEHLEWDQDKNKLLTPTAIFTVLRPAAPTIVSILRTTPVTAKTDFAAKDHLRRMLVVPPVTEEHIRQAYKSAKLALTVLLEDLPKAIAAPECADIIGHIPGSNIDNGMQDATCILHTLAIRPFQALISSMNMRDISHFDAAMDEAWEFQEGHTLFAAPCATDAPAPKALPDECVDA